MKILYQHRTLADGAEGIHISEMVEAFERLGHHVTMHALVSASARGEGASGFWSRAKAALPAPVFEAAALVYNVVDYVRFLGAIRRVRPDLVYKRHAIYDIGIILAARTAGVPVILEANGAYSSLQNQMFERVTFKRLARWFEQIAVNQATVVIAVSTPMAQYLGSLTERPRQVVVVPNGANPERFKPDETRGRAVRERFGLTGRVVIGWAGILREWHRLDLLLAALPAVPDARLLVVGDGPDRSRLKQRAVALGVADRVHITGRVPHAEMPEYVSAFDVAVASHDGTGYASPMKLLEYMAAGVPLVAPRMRNIEDFVEDGVDGLLFAPGDAGALAVAVRRLVVDPELRDRIGRQAREKIVSERNWRNIAATILSEVSIRTGRVTPIPGGSELPGGFRTP